MPARDKQSQEPCCHFTQDLEGNGSREAGTVPPSSKHKGAVLPLTQDCVALNISRHPSATPESVMSQQSGILPSLFRHGPQAGAFKHPWPSPWQVIRVSRHLRCRPQQAGSVQAPVSNSWCARKSEPAISIACSCEYGPQAAILKHSPVNTPWAAGNTLSIRVSHHLRCRPQQAGSEQAPVSRPWASGEYAIRVVPPSSQAFFTPLRSGFRYSRLYCTWLEARGMPRSCTHLQAVPRAGHQSPVLHGSLQVRWGVAKLTTCMQLALAWSNVQVVRCALISC